MNVSASKTVTFAKYCSTGTSSGEFCHELVIDKKLSPDTVKIDPCPHLFLRYYSSNASDINIHSKNCLVNNHGVQLEEKEEVIQVINKTGSLKFCPFGDITYSWSGVSIGNCANSNGLISFKGKNITAPGTGTLKVKYSVRYFLLEVVPSSLSQNTVVVCQNKLSSTYIFTPEDCKFIPSESSCCKSIIDKIASLNVELSMDSISGSERALKQHEFNILTRGVYIDPIEVKSDPLVISKFRLIGHGGCPPYTWTLKDSTRKDIKLHRLPNFTPSIDDTVFFLPNMGLQCDLTVEAEGIGTNDVVLIDYCGNSGELYINLASDCDSHPVSVNVPILVRPNNDYQIYATGIPPFNWYFCGNMGVKYQIDFKQEITYGNSNTMTVFDHIGSNSEFTFTICVTDACGHTVSKNINYLK